MDLRQKAQGAPYYLATSMEECPLERFWVVQLSCDIEIYQSEPDSSCDEPNPWMRLKQFCEDNDTKPINMARAGKDLNPAKQINFDPLADAYFYAKRARKLLAGDPRLSGYEDHAQGFGQVYATTLKIIWEFDDGRGFELEERDLGEHPKSSTGSLIYKD